MPILSQRRSLWLALFAMAVAGVALALVLLFVLRDDEDAADFPSARLVPGDAFFYMHLNMDTDANAAPGNMVAPLWESIAHEAGFDPDGAIGRSLRSAAVFSPNPYGSRDSFIFGVRDAEGLQAIESRLLARGLNQREYEGISYHVTDDGRAFAVIGDHFVSTIGAPAMRAIIDTWRGEGAALAASDDFRDLRRKALKGDATAFLYLDAGSLMETIQDDASGTELTALLSLTGLDSLFARPMGVLMHAGESAFRMKAAMLGDPGPLVHLLRPRDSRFAHMVPAETPVFLSTYDIAGVLDAMIGENDLAARLRDAFLDSLDDGGGLARLDDVLSLFEGEVAIAQLPSAAGEEEEASVLLAEVDDEDHARDVLEAFLRESPDAGDATLWVGDGIAIVATSAAAADAVRAADGPSLASSERYTALVDRLDERLAAFAWIDVAWLGMPWLFEAMQGDLDALDGLDGDGESALIVNVFWKDGLMQVESAFTD